MAVPRGALRAIWMAGGDRAEWECRARKFVVVAAKGGEMAVLSPAISIHAGYVYVWREFGAVSFHFQRTPLRLEPYEKSSKSTAWVSIKLLVLTTLYIWGINHECRIHSLPSSTIQSHLSSFQYCTWRSLFSSLHLLFLLRVYVLLHERVLTLS